MTATAFALSFDNDAGGASPGLRSSHTAGLRLNGRGRVAEGLELAYALAGARQTDLRGGEDFGLGYLAGDLA